MIFVNLLIALSAFLWIVFQRLDLVGLYGVNLQLVQSLPLSVYGWIVVVSCLLVFLTVILEQLKSYGMMYLLSRTVFEISLFGVSVLSFSSLFFCFRHLKNLWLDLIPVVFIPYFGVFVAMVMFQLFDFNYPYKKRVVQHMLLSVVAVVLVFMHLL